MYNIRKVSQNPLRVLPGPPAGACADDVPEHGDGLDAAGVLLRRELLAPAEGVHDVHAARDVPDLPEAGSRVAALDGFFPQHTLNSAHNTYYYYTHASASYIFLCYTGSI